MASSKNDSLNKRKIWDDSPITFTEFGALSSEVKPSGGFFSRLWKKNKDEETLTQSSTSLPQDETIPSANREDVRAVSSPPEAGGASSSISRQSSRSSSSLADPDSIEHRDDLRESPGTVHPHRTLTSVLSRLGSILDQRSSTPQTYKDSDFKQYWMPDSSCRECYDCGDKFTTFKRRHHCRICGQIFCSNCCNQELPGKIIGYKGGIRVCTYCCRVVQRYAQRSASTGDMRALEDLRLMTQIDHESGSFDFGNNRANSPGRQSSEEHAAPYHSAPKYRGDQVLELPGLKAPDHVHSTPFDLTPLSEFSSQESLLLESKILTQDSVQLRELWRQICDEETGVETQTHRIRLRTHLNCIVGKELVDWLLNHDRAATRDQAMAIGQALIYAGFLDSVANNVAVFRDDFTLYKPGETLFEMVGDAEAPLTLQAGPDAMEPTWFREITKSTDADNDDSTTHSHTSNVMDTETTISNASTESDTKTVYHLMENTQSGSGSFSENPKTVTLMSRDLMEEPLPRQDSSVQGLGEDFLKGALFLGKSTMPSSDVVTCPHGWRAVEQLREENGEKLAYERLKNAHKEHWQVLIRQLLGQYGLPLTWESVVQTCISQVSHFVRPDVRLEGDDMDIRNYVHIKKVPGGNKGDTTMFHGVVFTKNIAHKKMKSKVTNPLILLLRGTIEFQRVENKFSSLEPQILQEREFMRNCVAKMIAYRPNVIVIEKAVSRLAQEFLLEAGITLLYNVKLSVMERLARFTQAHIVPSIDGLVSKPNMGFCHDFRVQTFTLPNKETKTLAIFDGCATHLGCTIVLRGGSPSELHRVKHVVKFMAYTSYNSLLELCYCMDEFALPQPEVDDSHEPFDLSSNLGNSQNTQETSESKQGDKYFRTHLESGSQVEIGFEIEDDKDSDFQLVNFPSLLGVRPTKHAEEITRDRANSQPTDLQEKISVLEETSDNFDNVNDKHVGEREPSKIPQQSDTIMKTNSSTLGTNVITDKGLETSKQELKQTLIPQTNPPSITIEDEYSSHAHEPGLETPHEKVRHPSGLSVASNLTSEPLSGRSTPEIHQECEWSGIPKLIGKILCIIPPSAIPIRQISTDPVGDSSEKKASHSSKGSGSLVLDDASSSEGSQSNSSKATESTESSNVLMRKQLSELSMSEKESLTGDSDVPSMSRQSSINGNRTSTSKITELTDFSDPLLSYHHTQDESIFHPTNTQMALKEIKQSKAKLFRKALDGVHLSVSPYHKYTVPFIETDPGARCAVRRYLPKDVFWSSLFEGEGSLRPQKSKAQDPEGSKSSKSVEILQSHPFITINLTEPLWERSVQSILSDFRARGGRINLLQPSPQKSLAPIESRGGDMFGSEVGGTPLWEKKLDCLDPVNHQRLMVLFSSFSYKSNNHPYPCVYPWVVTMEFYGRNDITLGGFLERFCFRQQYTCPSPTCDTPMTDHVRRFVHGTACINVLLKKLESEVPGGRDNILMWSWCRKCKQVTPVVPISGDTWSLSFAKYLDLRFHSSTFLRRGSAEQCPHSLHHDHFQYFGHRNIVASFKFSNIALKGLALPASSVSMKPPTFDSVALIDQVKRITYKAMDRYSVILESTMKLKQELPGEAQQSRIQEFLQEQQLDKQNFRDAATNIQMKVKELIHAVTGLVNAGQAGHTDHDMTFYLHSIFDNTELLKRHICEDVLKWNARMQEFMVHQQKKSRTLTTKKERDFIGSSSVADESLKSSHERTSSKPSDSPSNVLEPDHHTSDTHSTGMSLPECGMSEHVVLGQTEAEDNTLKDSEAPPEADPNSLPRQLSSPTSTSSSGTSSPLNTATALALTTASTSAASSAPDLSLPGSPAQTVHGVALSTSSGHSGPSGTHPDGAPDDAADGLYQDLKGFARRFLSQSHFTPLALPFDLHEHHTLPLCERVPVAVNDNEPSSIIAYALSSSDYLYGLREIQTASRPSSTDPFSDKQTKGKARDLSSQTSVSVDSGDAGKKPGGVLSFLRGAKDSYIGAQGTNITVEAVHYAPGVERDRAESVYVTDPLGPLDGLDSPDGRGPGDSGPSPHIEIQFTDSTAKFYCRVYYADQFRKLRKLIFPGCDNLFIRSLSRCRAWEAKGGKSGSAFSKTIDDRFILKQMSNMEVESFEKFGPQYFQYIKTCIKDQQPTALAKILGVFRIGFRNSQTNLALRQDVLVMENLFYNRKIIQKYDLKGSMRNRLVNTARDRPREEELVLLDENLLKGSVESPLYVRAHSKAVLKAAITCDTTFLSTNLVMDYSLLVGIDDDTQELVVGIIDYIRTFTWDKKLETLVKSSGILGGQGKLPTVVSPGLYKGRFLEAMDRYFLQVPDRWMGLGRESPAHTNKTEADENKENSKR